MPRTADQNRHQKTTDAAHHTFLVCHVIFSPDRECYGNNFLYSETSCQQDGYGMKRQTA